MTAPGLCLHELFARQALRRPDAAAVSCGERRLSYGEVERRSNQLGRFLRSLGVGPEALVGLYLARSVDMVVAILGVLKAGGAYVPLDLSLPRERLAFMLRDAGLRWVLTESRLEAELPASDAARICLDQEWGRIARGTAAAPQSGVAPEHLAYVVYTSGSTGLPKGVRVGHGNVTRLFSASQPWFGFGDEDVWTLFHSYAFDFSVWELWGALLHGGRLVVVPAWISRSADDLWRLLSRERVTVLNQTPSAFHQLLGAGAAPAPDELSLRWVIFGGEALDIHSLRPWWQRYGALHPRLVNMYGITETTVHVTCRPLGLDDLDQPARSWIGLPLPDLAVHLLDGFGEPVSAGCAGELCVGGAGVARGYLNRPELEAERLVPDPFSGAAGARLYRSGDLARRLPSGDLEYLGRIDQQVKIRGYRIEPGEIEAVLAQHPGVEQCVVVVRDFGGDDRRLVAWLVPAVRQAIAAPEAAGAPADGRERRRLIASVRAFARQRLPEYMVPSTWMPRESMPLTPNGKVDRKALRLAAADWQGEPEGEAPRTPVEEMVALLWSRVLGVGQVGPHGNFFELGGHSLLVPPLLALVREAFGVELAPGELFAAPTVGALARRIEDAQRGASAAALPPLVARRPPGSPGQPARLPLSFAQQRLWFLDRLAPASPAYNLPLAMWVRGPLVPAALAAGLAAVVGRHEALRSRFVEVGGEAWQEIAAAQPVPLPLLDLASLPRARRAPALARIAMADAPRPFDLARGPLLRAALVRLGEGESEGRDPRLADGGHVLLLTLHHIAFDGWSEAVLQAELAALYAAAVTGRPSPLRELAVQYADFAAWQRAWPEAVLAEQLAWWRGQLAGAPAVLELPADRQRPAVQSFRGAVRRLRLPAEAAARLRQAARREGATLYMLLLAGFAALLARYSGQEDLLVGTPAANRMRPEIEGLIGFFVNTLAMRVRLAGDPHLRQLLPAVRDTALAALAHQDLPFEALVEELRPERDLARGPLVQVLLAFQSAARAAAVHGAIAAPGQVPAGAPAPTGGAAGEAGLRFTRLRIGDWTTAKFDLALVVEEIHEGPGGPGALALDLEAAADLFTAATAVRLLEHYAALLGGAVATPELPLSQLPLLAAAERHQLLAEWNDTARGPAGGPWVHELVVAQAGRTPDAVAVADRPRWVTYGELDRRARRLAATLRGLGVRPEMRVGVGLERSPELVATVLAVLETGGAYVALDPFLPAERLRFQLADSQVPVLIARRGELADLAAGLGIRCLDPGESPAGRDSAGNAAAGAAAAGGPPAPAAPSQPPPLAPGNLAYVIYTSGSTGRPKGVELSHGSLCNLVAWHRRRFAVTATDRAALIAGVGFDASVWETWPYLAAGASLHVLPEAVRIAPEQLRDWMLAQGITMTWLPVPLAEAALDLRWDGEGARLPVPRRLLTGGDRLLRYPPASLPFELVNAYGPSEGTVVAVTGRVPAEGSDGLPWRGPALGRPIDGVRTHVCLASGQPAPVGVPGELRIGGAGLARGYLRLPDLTAERFVPDPFAGAPGERLYRTGDLVRWLADGEIEFLGRIDHQVKIRGVRLELGEVEAVLAAHPAVREVAVLAIDGSLTAFFSARGPVAPEAPELSALARRRLPEAATPVRFVRLAALPRNASDKIDRQALAQLARRPEPEATAGGRRSIPHGGSVEELVAGIWEEVLGRAPVRSDDNFFQLGGHSLLVTRVLARLRAAFGVDLPVKTLFEQPTVSALARAVTAARQQGDEIRLPPLRPVPRGAWLPLSSAQRRLWFLDRLAPGRATYNIPAAYELRGTPVPAALAAALSEIVRRHEVLRTRFVEAGGEPWQEIEAPRALALPRIDLRGLRRTCLETAELARLRREEAMRPFDLARGPLLRARLVEAGGGEPPRRPAVVPPGGNEANVRLILLLTLHHIVADGWSEQVLLGELSALHAAAVERRPSPLAEPAIQYADFAAWQCAWPEEVMARQLAWWRRQLAGAPVELPLPADRPRPPVQSFRGAVRALRLPAAVVACLRQAARREGATLYMLLLAGFAALLARYGGREDLLIGTPVANRSLQEIEGLIGFFVNTLALRVRLDGDPDLRRLLAAVRETVLGALAHQDLPFETLVEELRPGRDLAWNPLVQVLLVLQSAGTPGGVSGSDAEAGVRRASGAAESLRCQRLPSGERATAKFDLSLIVEELEDETGGPALALELEVAADLFTAATAARLLEHYATLLRGAAAAPELPLAQLPLLGAAERHQLMAEWNDTASGAPRRTLHALFEEQAAARPDAVALVWEQGVLTYGALDREAGRIAGGLRRLGVGPEARVGLCVERSAEMVAAVLGILKAGGAYLPLDPSLPRRRLEAMVADAAPAAIVGPPRLLDAVPGTAPRLALQAPLLPREVAPRAAAAGRPEESDGGRTSRLAGRSRQEAEGLAYVLYTSGSTGTPKGVAVAHRAVVRLVRDTGYAAFGPGEVFLQLAPMSFDAATFEIWGPLLHGGCLVLFPPRQVSVRELQAVVLRHGVTTLWLTAGLFHLAVDEGLDGLRGLRQLLTGGDVLSPSHVGRALAALPGVELINGYGPTENTTFSCCYRVRRGLDGDAGEGPVPIGSPIVGSRVYVLDRLLQPVPAGCAGELFVGGAGVARGYLGRPELTAESFLPDPFGGLAAADGGGARLYRTGDLARWRPGGTLEFLGRRDFQVKVRGFRIEPGEIEALLGRHPAVREVVVAAVAEAGRDHRLAAYYVPAEPVTAAELRAFLRERLPEPMVPSAFVPLAALPLTPHGKIDRRALPAPEELPAAADAAGAASRTPLEEVIAGIWEEVLSSGLPGWAAIGMDDTFFDLGGHSLLVIRVLSRLRQVLGVDLPVQALFECPTVRGLARLVASARQEAAEVALPPLVPVPRGARLPLSYAQQRLWFLDRLAPDRPTYNIPAAYRLHGPMAPPALAAALTEVVRRHEALRTRFVEADGRLWQEIQPPRPVPLPLIDLGELGRRPLAPGPRRAGAARRPPAANPRSAELARLSQEEALRPFDLAAGPLLRAALVRLGEDEGRDPRPAVRGEEALHPGGAPAAPSCCHVLLLNLHHIVSDGWSERVLLGELAALHGAALERRPSPLRELALQYADFAAWQRAWPEAVVSAQLAYWQQQLASAPMVLALPEDRPQRPPSAVARSRGLSRGLLLPAAVAERLRRLARQEGVTLYMLLLAGFAVLLARYTGQEDLLIGAPVANRARPETGALIGFFVNLLPLRVRLEDDPDFRRLLAAVRQTTLAALDHQDLPFEVLVEELQPERDLARSPVVQAVLALQTADRVAAASGAAASGALRFTQLPPGERTTAKFDLSLDVAEVEGEGDGVAASLALAVEVALDRFTAATAARLLSHYATLLDGAVGAPELPLSQLPLLAEAERHQVLAEWNDTAAPLPELPLVHELFAAHARARPHATAAATRAARLTYGELERRANRLAHHLRARGVGPEVPVAICADRTLARVVGIVAVLKAGGAYVSLDPGYPRERLAFLLDDARARVLLTEERFAARLPASAAEVIRLDGSWESITGDESAAPATCVTSRHPAYVIYTSGSTGMPKGVEIPHAGLLNLVRWYQACFGLRPGDRGTQIASPAFDASVVELWPFLAGGGELHIPDEETRLSAAGMLRWWAEAGITLAFLMTPLAEGVMERLEQDAAPCPALPVRSLFVGGDRLHHRPVPAVRFRLWNTYGPAEYSVTTSAVAVAADGPGLPSIGRPLPNTRIYVLDRRQQPVPAGVPGELHVAGVGLARGYLGRPELTAEKFVPDPWGEEPGARMYRTADLVRHLPDGDIDFLGRIDHQVKLRGHRIELGEIESVLGRHPGVREAVVLAREKRRGDKRLVGYVVPAAEPGPAADELRAFLHERLPDYMVPRSYVELSALPLTPNGKVDRRALPEPDQGAAAAPPETETEALLVEVWRQFLGCEVGIDDNLFDLGAHSLLAPQFVARVQEIFQLELPLYVLFESPSVRQLALAVQEALLAEIEELTEEEAERLAG